MLFRMQNFILKKIVTLYRNFTNSASLPETINLDVTWKCNINCVMCSARQRINKFGIEDLTADRFRHIIKEIPSLKLIYIMGLGEPLMNPYIYEIMEAACAKGIQLSIITNGMLLTKGNISKFSDSLKFVNISIDGTDPAVFDRIRKGAKFSEVTNNIRELKKLRPDIKITILHVLMKDTIEDLPNLVKYSKKVGADCISVNHILSLEKSFNDKKRITSRVKGAQAILDQATALANQYGIEFISRPLEPTTRPCWQPWSGPLIMLNGDIFPCVFMDQSHKTVCSEWYEGVALEVPYDNYKFGNIFEDSFKKIWNGNDFKAVRKMLNRCNINEHMSIKEFNEFREQYELNEKYSYCKVCLWRWTSAC